MRRNLLHTAQCSASRFNRVSQCRAYAFKAPTLSDIFSARAPTLYRSVSSTLEASGLLQRLREHGDRLVEVEHGRYDDYASLITMPLSKYLDWLESAPTATVSGQQLYLAQQADLYSLLSDLLPLPPVIESMKSDRQIDIYQISCFLGARDAMTPLHRDPYENLFCGLQNNTAAVHDDQVAALEGAQTFELRQGDALYIPRGIFHRVENVDEQAAGPSWSLGFGIWFLRS